MLSRAKYARSHRVPGWLCVPLLLASLHAQTTPDSPSVVIRSNVRLVQIDVIAKDKHGNPVPGLDEKDFSLLDDGVPQKVRRISVEHNLGASVNRTATATGTKLAGPPTFSNTHPENVVPTVILLDVLNTSSQDQASMKKGLLHSLNRMKDGTPVALLILGDSLTVVSDFTTSEISLANAAAGGFGLGAEGFGPPIVARATGNPTRDKMIMKATTGAFHAEDHERVVRALAALNLISQQLSHMPGRKSLLWITGGVNTSSDSADLQDALDKLNDANVTVYTVDARGVLLDPGNTAETDTNDLTEPVKIDREESRGDVLFSAAAATGGVAYHNTNNLDGVISQAMADRELVYVLDYYPILKDWNGKLHKIQVKTSRPGVRLRYRASYRAILPSRPNAQDQQEMLASAASGSLESAGIHFDVQMEPGPAADPRLRLHIPSAELEWSAKEEKMLDTLDVWFIQKRANGEDLATNHMKADLRLSADVYATTVQQGVSLASDFKLDPSAAKVRVMIRDEASGKIGTVDVPVDQKTARPPL